MLGSPGLKALPAGLLQRLRGSVHLCAHPTGYGFCASLAARVPVPMPAAATSPSCSQALWIVPWLLQGAKAVPSSLMVPWDGGSMEQHPWD